MTEIYEDKKINIEELLKDFDCRFQGTGPVLRIDVPKIKINDVYKFLLSKKDHFKVYLKENIPEFYYYSDHPFISPIILVADIGWSLITNKDLNKSYVSKGNHGYEKDHLDMHGVFMAKGPAFKENYKTGTLWNIDIYPLLCKIYDINGRSNIDGKLERIEFILKEN